MAESDDDFELYDLRVEVTAPPGGRIYCGAKPGDYFEMRGEMIHFPPGQGFSIYSLAALLPLLPAKQRPTHRNDWMTSDAEVACPDPNCSCLLYTSPQFEVVYSSPNAKIFMLHAAAPHMGPWSTVKPLPEHLAAPPESPPK